MLLAFKGSTEDELSIPSDYCKIYKLLKEGESMWGKGEKQETGVGREGGREGARGSETEKEDTKK